MSHFFQPNSKVQKDRHIMRETDARMAKYSRRGLIFNFIAFLICLLGGRFVDENRELTVVLAAGLLLVTMLRGYYLFRFDQHYPRGPARWRNVYFVVTLVGAIWWGVILSSVTLTLGLNDEAPLLWLYTVVFFSTTAHAFAPYHRFLSYYQFLGLVPAAAASVWIGGWEGYIYGALMLMFYLILSHQCRLISDNYWEKLEAGYALSKRVSSEDHERTNIQSSLMLNKEFLINLEKSFNELASDEEETAALSQSRLASIKRNIRLFKDVQYKELKTSSRVFNVRHELQSLTSEFVDKAEKLKVQIETSLSTNLPMRLKGDPVRFAQIVRTILKQSLENCSSPTLVVEAQFLREFESAGELHIAIKQEKNKASAMPFFTGTAKREMPRSVELSIAKGLAELFGGEIEIIELADKDFEIRFSCRLDIVDRAGHLDFHKDRFHGAKILLISSSESIAALKRQELDALGFITTTETNFKRVTSTLIHQVKTGNAIENILIYHDPSNEASQHLLAELRAADELKSLNKVIAASESNQQKLISGGFTEELGFYFVSKPLGLFELESTFDYMFSSKGDETSLRLCRDGTVIIVGDKEELRSIQVNCDLLPNQKVLTCSSADLEKTLDIAYNIMVVVPCNGSTNPSAVLSTIREFEARHEASEVFIPVVGIGENGCSCADIAAFEIGFDDFIDMDTARASTLTSTLRYWRSITR